MSVRITSFYQFRPLTDGEVRHIQSRLAEFARAGAGVKGLCLLGNEGINATISGDDDVIEDLKRLVVNDLGFTDIDFKDSAAKIHPFLEFKIKVKNEIVTLGRPGLTPPDKRFHHLSADEWQLAMKDPETLVIDTRNDYEVEIGKFRGAIDFNLKEFHDFPGRLRDSGIAKDKRVLIYCTGGIRCEKAILAMHEQGFENVQQLDGGILRYLEQKPNEDFEGECFVFDHRVAVDQSLRPTDKFKLCPHCGQPADKPVECVKCSSSVVICRHCLDGGNKTCSKNCAHHFAINSRSRRQQKLDRFGSDQG